jgi:SAM-dependent methyltransferase
MRSMSAVDWDARYHGPDLVWSATPNMWVAEQTRDLTPGRVLDLACGEGSNSIFLAQQGWQVTGADFAVAGLDKARTLAQSQPAPATPIQWVRADATTFTSTTAFDLVMLVYLQLPSLQRRAAIHAAWHVLAPGGILLVIAHHRDNLSGGVGGPQDPEVLYTPQDVLADLALIDPAAMIRQAQRVERAVTGHDRPALDTLVRAGKASLDQASGG